MGIDDKVPGAGKPFEDAAKGRELEERSQAGMRQAVEAALAALECGSRSAL